MKNVSHIYVGVDISKDTLDAYIHPINKKLHIINTIEGCTSFISSLISYNVTNVVCESSGGYEQVLLHTLQKAGISYWVVDPRRIKAFIRSEGINVKTDPHDAKMIALFAASKKPSYIPYVRTEKDEYIFTMVRRVIDLKKIMASEKNRLAHPNQSFHKNNITNHILFLEKQIKFLENEIEQLIKYNEVWRNKSRIMRSVPGIGKVTVMVLISHVPELGTLTKRQIAALIGVAPITKQSGLWKGRSMIYGGRKDPRNVLYMAALTACRCNPVFKTFYKRLISINKKEKVAKVAVMRKIIITLNTMILKGVLWNPIVRI